MTHSLAHDSPKAPGAGCQRHEGVRQGFLAQFQVLSSDPAPLWYAAVVPAAVEPVASAEGVPAWRGSPMWLLAVCCEVLCCIWTWKSCPGNF